MNTNEQPENSQSEQPSSTVGQSATRTITDSAEVNSGKDSKSNTNMTPQVDAHTNVDKTKPASTTNGKTGSTT
jgi:hypothetical protein